MILGLNLATGSQLLSFNRTKSRAVIGLLTGSNTLRKHLYIMGLSNNPNCRKCGTEEVTSVHILCACEALSSLRHTYLGSFFLDPENIRKVSMGPYGTLVKEQGSLNLVIDYGAQRACIKAQVHQAWEVSNPNAIQFNSMSLSHNCYSHFKKL